MVPISPLPGHGLIRAEEYCLLECKIQIAKVSQCMDPGLVSLYFKSVLLGECLPSLGIA